MSYRILRSYKQMTLLGIATLFIVILVSSAVMPLEQIRAEGGSGSSANWTSFTLDNNNSRYQTGTYINSSNVRTLGSAWFFPAHHSVTSTPVVDDGHVYFSDWGGNVYSLDITTGSDQGPGDWNTSVVGQLGLVNFAISSTPAVSNGVVYVAGSPLYSTQTNRSILFALNQSTGALEWSTTLRYGAGGIYSSPIVYNGLVYVGTSDCHEAGELAYCSEATNDNVGQIFAVNSTTHAMQWSFDTGNGTQGGGFGGGVWGSVVVDPSLNSIYFGTANSYNASVLSENANQYAYSILSMNAVTGKLNWNYTISPNEQVGDDNDFGSTPNLFTLDYGGTTYQAIGINPKIGPYYILNRQNGQFITSMKMGSGSTESIGSAGFVYLPGESASPEIFVPNSAGYIQEFIPANGTSPIATSAQIGTLYGSEVALAPGVVFVGDSSGNLYAFSMQGLKNLWNVTLPHLSDGYGIQSGVSISGAYIFVGDDEMTPKESPALNNGGLYAFSLPANEISTTTTSASTTSTTTTSSSSANSSSIGVTQTSTTQTLTSQTTSTTSSSVQNTNLPVSTTIIIGAIIVAVVIVSATAVSIYARRR